MYIITEMFSILAKHKNDIIYLSLLLLSIIIGPYYRRIHAIYAKKWAGSILGLLLLFIVSGYSAIHPILSGTLGIIAIKTATVR